MKKIWLFLSDRPQQKNWRREICNRWWRFLTSTMMDTSMWRTFYFSSRHKVTKTCVEEQRQRSIKRVDSLNCMSNLYARYHDSLCWRRITTKRLMNWEHHFRKSSPASKLSKQSLRDNWSSLMRCGAILAWAKSKWMLFIGGSMTGLTTKSHWMNSGSTFGQGLERQLSRRRQSSNQKESLHSLLAIIKVWRIWL